jgi:hypothetical protein
MSNSGPFCGLRLGVNRQYPAIHCVPERRVSSLMIRKLHAAETRSMKKFSDEEVASATKELAKVRKQWLRRPGVTAVDVGYKMVGGRLQDELAIRVHVKRKRPREELSEDEVFPSHLGRFAVDVIEADYKPQSP